MRTFSPVDFQNINSLKRPFSYSGLFESSINNVHENIYREWILKEIYHRDITWPLIEESCINKRICVHLKWKAWEFERILQTNL